MTSTITLNGASYGVLRAGYRVYLDAPARNRDDIGLGLLRVCGVNVTGPELKPNGGTDEAKARAYVSGWDAAELLTPAERTQAIATVAEALPQLRALLGGAS